MNIEVGEKIMVVMRLWIKTETRINYTANYLTEYGQAKLRLQNLQFT